MGEPLLEIKNLRVSFRVDKAKVVAVDDVSLSVTAGETLALVGESGCGKSVTLLSILQLLNSPASCIDGGQVIFKGTDLLKLPSSEIRQIRGNQIAMIFQEPMTSLDPVFTVGRQLTETVQLHQHVSRKAAWASSIEMLRLVGIADAERRADEYPHQMSGGMRQRVMIAIALSCKPSLLLADEPTTALDVTIQAQILDLIRKLKEELSMGVVLVTHDLGVVAEMARRVAVMYAGRIVEQGDVYSLFRNPLHPYTEGLLRSIPRLEENLPRLRVIEGSVPEAGAFPQGCRFHPRCPLAFDMCRAEEPLLATVESDRTVACHLAAERVCGGKRAEWAQ